VPKPGPAGRDRRNYINNIGDEPYPASLSTGVKARRSTSFQLMSIPYRTSEECPQGRPERRLGDHDRQTSTLC
jgi:hypothetical protein